MNLTPTFSTGAIGRPTLDPEQERIARLLEALVTQTPGGLVQSTGETLGMVGDVLGSIGQPQRAEALGQQVRRTLPDIVSAVTQRPAEVATAFGQGMEQEVLDKGAGAVFGLEDLILPGGKTLGMLGAGAMAMGKLPPASKAAQDIVDLSTARQTPAIVGSMRQEVSDLIDSRMANPGNFDLNKNTSIPKSDLTNPAVRRREEMRAGGETVIEDAPTSPARTLQPEALLGGVGVPFVADKSRAGGYLSQVGGVPLDSPVYLQGGPDYPAVINPDAAWASNYNISSGKQQNVAKAVKDTGIVEPYGIFVAMADSGIDFSTPVVEAMARQIDTIGIPQSDKKNFTRAINDVIDSVNAERIAKAEAAGRTPNLLDSFVGFDNVDEAIEQLFGRGQYKYKGAGDLRKLVVQTMNNKGWRSVGFPVYRDVARAVTDPNLLQTRRGDAGYSVMRLDPTTDKVPKPGSAEAIDTRHYSYDTIIPKAPNQEAFVGGFAEDVPPEIMFPRTFEKLATQRTTAGQPLTQSQKIGSLAAAHHWEVFDEAWVDRMNEYFKQIKERGISKDAALLAALTIGGVQLSEMDEQ